MSMTDPIADMLTRIRNANIAMHDEVSMPSSKQKVALAEVLQSEGYIDGFSAIDNVDRPGATLTINMKYSPERQRVISGLKRVSKPGLRVYTKNDQIPRGPRWPGCGRVVDQQGIDHRPGGPQGQGRRRGPLLRLVAGIESRALSRSRRRTCHASETPPSRPVGSRDLPVGRRGHGEGPEGHAGAHSPRGDLDGGRGRDGDADPGQRRRESKALHGLSRSLVNNMIIGVSEGFRKDLEIIGVGYRANAKGKDKLELALGFSHPVTVQAPEGIEFDVPEPTKIGVIGIDKQVVGQVAAEIRAYRKPEPYKGKGVRYVGERVIRKAGKAGK